MAACSMADTIMCGFSPVRAAAGASGPQLADQGEKDYLVRFGSRTGEDKISLWGFALRRRED